MSGIKLYYFYRFTFIITAHMFPEMKIETETRDYWTSTHNSDSIAINPIQIHADPSEHWEVSDGKTQNTWPDLGSELRGYGWVVALALATN